MKAILALSGCLYPIDMQSWYNTDPPSSGSIFSLLEGGEIARGTPPSGRISYWTWAN